MSKPEDDIASEQKEEANAPPLAPDPPYPWCHGSPTREECARRGYCNRDPNCGD